MADPVHRDSGAAIDVFLERKDHEHTVGDPLHRPQAAGPPRPELRTDVVHHRHTEPSQPPGEPEVEIWKVDRHEDVGPVRLGVGKQPPVRRVRPRQHARDLEQAGDRQALEVGNQAGSRITQPLTAEAGDLCRRIELANLARERAGVQVAGRFAARDHHAHESDSLVPAAVAQLGLVKRAGSSGMLYPTLCTRRLTNGCPPLRTVAPNATLTPPMLR